MPVPSETPAFHLLNGVLLIDIQITEAVPAVREFYISFLKINEPARATNWPNWPHDNKTNITFILKKQKTQKLANQQHINPNKKEL